MSVDARQQCERAAVEALQGARVGLRAIVPRAVVVLAGENETGLARNPGDRCRELVVSAHGAQVARSEEVAGVRQMHVTVGECRQHGRAAEVDAFGADPGRVFSERHDRALVDEQRIVAPQLRAARVERVDARVMEELHRVKIR